MSDLYNRQREINEAAAAGQRALNSLYDARQQLRQARNWGIVDILGGGIFVTFAKHRKISNAQQCVSQAKWDLQCFANELNDVNAYTEVDFGISDFLVFADYFFDGMLADFFVQSKINEASRQVETAIQRVEYLLNQLKYL